MPLVLSVEAWVTALDSAALHAVTDLMRWLGGEERLFLNWAFRLAVDTHTLKLGVPVLLAFWIWVRPSGYAADPVRASPSRRHPAGHGDRPRRADRPA